MGDIERLLELLNSDCCDYDICRQIIAKIGGATQIIEGKFGLKTTPLHEVIECGHYDFAMELINEPGANLDVDPDGWGTLIWELQYLDAETQEERDLESEYKLKLIRALIGAGANPNPKGDNEELIWWIRFKLNDEDGDHHLWQMEHIIEAHTYGKTEQFFNKLKETAVCQILISNYGFWLLDDNLCWSDRAVFVFDDGERMALSSYQVGDDEWNFYAVSVRENIMLDPDKYHIIMPKDGFSKILFSEYQEENNLSCWLDLIIDDAVLRFHAADPNIEVGIVGVEEGDYTYRKRKNLFETNN